ncbi:MAG: ThiF family adenylyltransferase [Oscillospiraceae bacterium]
MRQQTIRTEMLLGAAAMERLRGSHVAVLGLGGVGSWCAEALARAGVGELTLVDEDVVGESNLNRQCCALHSTLGQPKAAVMAARVRDIDPEIVVHPMAARYEAASRESFFAARYDYIADCIDLVSCKVDLICTAHARGVPILSALGTGNKADASRFVLCDLAETSGCPFARVLRRELRRAGIEHHDVVFSPEEALTPSQPETPPPGRRSIPGSLPWVPASAGLLMAQGIVQALVRA